MWPYTEEENNWLSRTGNNVLRYFEKVGTARASNRGAQYKEVIKLLDKHHRFIR